MDSLIEDFEEHLIGQEKGSLRDLYMDGLRQMRLPIRLGGLVLPSMLQTSSAAYFASTMRADALPA